MPRPMPQIPQPELSFNGKPNLMPLVSEFIDAAQRRSGAMRAVLEMMVEDPLTIDFEQLEETYQRVHEKLPDTEARQAERKVAFGVVKALFESQADSGISYDFATTRALGREPAVHTQRAYRRSIERGLDAVPDEQSQLQEQEIDLQQEIDRMESEGGITGYELQLRKARLGEVQAKLGLLPSRVSYLWDQRGAVERKVHVRELAVYVKRLQAWGRLGKTAVASSRPRS